MESLPPELSPTGYLAEVRRVLEHVEKTQLGGVLADHQARIL